MGFEIPGTGPVMLRPSASLGTGGLVTWRQLAVLVVAVGSGLVAAATMASLSGSGPADATAIAYPLLGVAVVALVFGYVWLYFRNARIEIDALNVKLFGAMGTFRTIQRPDIAQVRRFSVHTSKGPWPVGLIVGRDGRCLARVSPSFDLEALAGALGLEVSGSGEGSITWQEARARWPGIPWVPTRTTAILIGLGIFLAALVAAALLVIVAAQR